MLMPFNLHKWIEENRHLLKPPVNNKNLYVEAGDFIVMIVGGPNARKDYHFNESEEFFYQLEGDITVKVQLDGKPVEVQIKEGDVFLLPALTPHNPIRGANTVGLVIEKVRKGTDMVDGLMWFCDSCNHLLKEPLLPLLQVTSKASNETETLVTTTGTAVLILEGQSGKSSCT